MGLLPSAVVIDEEHRGLREKFEAYDSYLEPGVHFKIPYYHSIRQVKVAEQSVNIDSSDMITKDNLNASVDLVVYFQVRKNEESVKAAQYEADDYERQIVSLARTTARNVIGDMRFEEVNSERSKLNNKLKQELDEETDKWGIDVVRVEMEEITPPPDVQDSMNEIIKAENEKEAAQDRADARKIEASGEKEAAIEEAEGSKRAQILDAEGTAKAIETKAQAQAREIELVNTAIASHFTDKPQEYKKLEVVVDSLKNGSKYVIDSDSEMTAVLSEVGGVTPIEEEADVDESDLDFDMSGAAEEMRNAAEDIDPGGFGDGANR